MPTNGTHRVRGLSIVLQDVQIDLSQRELTSQQKTKLDGIMQGCGDLLKALEITVDKFQELDSSAKIPGKRSKRVWKRLTWDQKDIDEFRGRISSNTILLNTFLGHISR